jgi:RND superfamily putative drug exporter
MRSVTRFAIHRRKTVIVAWILVLVGVSMAAGAVGSDFRNVFSLPGTETQQVQDLLEKRFPSQAGESGQVVFHVDRGTLKDRKADIDKAVEAMGGAPDIAAVSSPLAPRGGGLTKDGRTGFGTVSFSKTIDELTKERVQKVVAAGAIARRNGLQVEFGGQPFELTTQQEGNTTELIGVLAAAVVLFLTFGSLVAMGLPLLTAIISLGTGIGLITLLTAVMDVADFAPQLATMIGLGVGIDYALFILTRYREELAAGHAYAPAAERAMATAGRAVLFAGITVVIALMGMLLLGISFLYGVAIAASLAVLLTMAAALTLLPAVLVALGGKINRLRLPRRRRKGEAATEQPAVAARSGAWARWAAFVERRPLPVALLGGLLVVLLALPALDLRLGSGDAGNDARTTTTRKAYDLLAAGFGPGFNGPLFIAVDLRGAQDKAVVTKLRSTLAEQPGVGAVTPARLNPAKDTALLQAYPASSPQSEKTKDVLDELRNDAVPPLERASGADIAIGGSTAGITDFDNVVRSKLPLFIGIVVALSVLLLMLAFRSILVPLKAAAMNILSIGASFGVVVAVFQKGWGADLIGVSQTGPIESFLPVMVFAIVFGLSMDYEVFLMSRVHEEWTRSGDATRAMTQGLARTGRVITAAATIMVLVFASFILLDERVIKLFGVGLASAIFIDAFIIRSLLVPAIMQLLGRWAWWLPSWLDRRLPHVDIEGADAPEPARA